MVGIKKDTIFIWTFIEENQNNTTPDKAQHYICLIPPCTEPKKAKH